MTNRVFGAVLGAFLVAEAVAAFFGRLEWVLIIFGAALVFVVVDLIRRPGRADEELDEHRSASLHAINRAMDFGAEFGAWAVPDDLEARVSYDGGITWQRESDPRPIHWRAEDHMADLYVDLTIDTSAFEANVRAVGRSVVEALRDSDAALGRRMRGTR